ncbi:hypothetical protein KR044_006786, partial [Drosophila immigrans]
EKAMESVNLSPEEPSGLCLMCLTKTCLVCHRCGDFYCSRECQLNDWQRHRYICFPIPPLVQPTACSVIASINAKDLQKEDIKNAHPPTIQLNNQQVPLHRNVAAPISIAAPVLENNSIKCDKQTKPAVNNVTPIVGTHNNADFTQTSTPSANIPSGSIVNVISFASANRCFIRDASESAEKAYFAVCEKVNSLCMELPRKTRIRYSEYGIGKFNGRYHRVKSIDRKNSSRLLLLDEGIIKILNLVDMREISKELLELPCCAMQVQIADVPFMGLAPKFCKSFEGNQFIVTFKPNGYVELKQKNALKSLNTQILEIVGHANHSDTQSNMTKKGPEVVIIENNAQLQLERRQNTEEINQKPTAIVNEGNTNNNQLKIKEINSTNIQADAKSEPSKETEPHLKEIESLSIPTPNKTIQANSNETNKNINIEPPQELDNGLYDKDNQILKEILASTSGQLSSENLMSFNSANSANPFEVQRLSSNIRDGLDVCIVENANVSRGIIAAFDRSNMIGISQMRNRLAEFQDSQPYRPVLKEYVLALSEVNGWCRAKIMEIKGNVYSVLYVDFASGGTVPEKSIRRYPAGFSMPCLTSICLIDGFPHKPSQRQIDFLNQNLKLDSILHIDSVSYLQDMALIKCKSLTDQLNIL